MKVKGKYVLPISSHFTEGLRSTIAVFIISTNFGSYPSGTSRVDCEVPTLAG